MKKVLSLLAVAGIAAVFAAPARADEFVARYTYLVNGAEAPIVNTSLTQPAVIGGTCGAPALLSQPAVVGDACGTTVLTQPAVAATAAPVMVEDHENIVPHFFHIGLWPLVDFSIF